VEPLEAILYYDLTTRDGRHAIEVRRAETIGNGMLYVSVRATIYSCAYNTQAGRIAAFGRATSFCNGNSVRILTFENGAGRRAVWQ